VQYTYARCNSLLEKADSIMGEPDYEGINNKEAMEVVGLLEKFPESLFETIEKYEPCYISRYLVDLAKAFNRFYYRHRIIDAEPELKTARLMLAKCVKTVIGEGLRLLGISAPAKM